MTKLGPLLEELPYGDLIRRCDGPDYSGSEGDYGPGVFGRDDFERLADQHADLSGKFILSINDTPGAREVVGRFAVKAVPVTYTIGWIRR